MNRRPFPCYLEDFSHQALLFTAYYIFGRIGLSIHPVDTFVPLFWPATGLALAVLVLYGYRMWPAITLAAFAVEFSLGAGFFVALGIAMGNTLEALAGAYFLQHYDGFSTSILRLRDNIGLIATALAIPIVGATVGIMSLSLGGDLTAITLGAAWSSWWVGDVFGILIIAPLLFKWLSKPLYRRTPLQFVELYLVAVVTFGISVFIFWMPEGQFDFDYFIFIPLTWATLRTGPRGTTLALFIAGGFAIVGTLAGWGAYNGPQGLFYVQIYLGTLSILFLLFTALIEERRRAQILLGTHVDELKQALHKISSEDEAKKEFLAVLAHELRNPLAAILSSVELLKLQGASAPDAPALLDTVDERVRAMATLLDDLLDVSRISRKKLKLKKETVALGPVIDRSVRMVGTLMQSRGHTLSVTKAADELYLEADPIRLEQIIVNLLNNAAKYTEPNGSIEITARREGEAAVIRVRDSGIGIPKYLLTRIFEPFFQIERGKTTTEGLGIGLSLTRQLVEMHGGTIVASSKGEQKGSEFTVRLPVLPDVEVPSPVDRKTLHGGRPLRAAKHVLRILVVDDNQAVAEGLSRLLKLRGHMTAVAYNGTDAVERALQFRPQAIILDIGLPDIDGYTVARTVRQQKDFSPVLIALTGYGQAEDKEKARAAGFDYHITKPVGLKELETILRKVPQTPAH